MIQDFAQVAYVKVTVFSCESVPAGKTLIKECLNESAEAGHVGVQANGEHQTKLESGTAQHWRAGFPKPGMGRAC
jgi:hypothetical protein